MTGDEFNEELNRLYRQRRGDPVTAEEEARLRVVQQLKVVSGTRNGRRPKGSPITRCG